MYPRPHPPSDSTSAARPAGGAGSERTPRYEQKKAVCRKWKWIIVGLMNVLKNERKKTRKQ